MKTATQRRERRELVAVLAGSMAIITLAFLWAECGGGAWGL